VRRLEYTAAKRGPDIRHHRFQQRVVRGTVIGDVALPAMAQVGIDAPIDGPVGIGLAGEFRT